MYVYADGHADYRNRLLFGKNDTGQYEDPLTSIFQDIRLENTHGLYKESPKFDIAWFV